MSETRPRGSRRALPLPVPGAVGRNLPGWAGLVLVALVAGALYLAGTSPHGIATSAPVSDRLSVTERTFSCAAGLGGTKLSVGAAATPRGGTVTVGKTKVQPPRSTALDAPGPVTVSSDRNAAPGAFAAQSASAASWLAMANCPEPRASWWVVGAGGSAAHGSVVTLSNPRQGGAVFDVVVLGPKGIVESPGLRGLSLGSGKSMKLNLAEVAPSEGDLAVGVTTSRGLVSVSTTDTWLQQAIAKPRSEWVPAQPEPAKSMVVLGSPDKPDSASLLVANPSSTEAIVKIEGVGSTGTFAPKDVATFNVAPGAVGAAPLKEVFDGKPAAIKVTAQVPVTATVRSVVGGDESYSGVAEELAGSSVIAVPTGVKAGVRMTALEGDGSATVAAFSAAGKKLGESVVKLGAGTSGGADVPAGAAYVVVTPTGKSSIAAALVASTPSGISTAVVQPAIRALRLPAVRSGF